MQPTSLEIATRTLGKGRFMAELLFKGLSFWARRSHAAFLKKTSQTERVQTNFLRSLLKHHQHTIYGQEHQFQDIATIEQYQERVLVKPYRHFDPYIDRMANGESNVLVADPLIFMNMTSGSTGKKKLIPVTQRSRRAVAAATQTALGFVSTAAQQQHRPLGQMLYSGSAKATGTTPGGITYGPVSTGDLKLSSSLYRQVFAYPFDALQVSSIQDRSYLCMLFALSQPQLKVISATFPILALRLAQDLDAWSNYLLHDLETGEISHQLKLDPALRDRLERQWRAHPQRAETLRKSQHTHGTLTPIGAWPHLSFIITARGGTSDVYFERFPDYFGDTPVFGGTYASAEATYGIHRGFNTDSVMLALESGFYEFIPEDQWDVENPKTVLPWNVTVGDRYRIVVTNYSGFYRYDVGDVVEIEGFTGTTPRFIFRYRYGGMISASTEKTTEFHVTQVMQRLQKSFHLKLENFCVTLSEDLVRPHYWVNIELASGYQLDDPTAFIQAFDAELKDVHFSYQVKRKDQVPPPKLRILAHGSFEQLRQRMVNQGVSEVQIKFPLVSENRTLLSDLVVEAEAGCEP
ncbi:MAG: GH3 auxin-responsive promoter family protein [Cyanobacteria bacterium P01_E01_bin.6]